MANVLDNEITGSEFEHQYGAFTFTFGLIPLGKLQNFLFPQLWIKYFYHCFSSFGIE